MGKKGLSLYRARPFESSKGGQWDPFGSIFETMVLSKAYQHLSTKQRDLYTHCKLQQYAQGKDRPDKVDQTQFYFNRSLWLKKYNLYKSGSAACFYKDMAKLIELGFIRCISSGKAARIKSIYQLSDKWALYGTEAFKINPKERTTTGCKYSKENKTG